MRKILAVCAFAFVTNVYADAYKCEFDGGKLFIDSVNKKFTLNNEIYDIEGMATDNGKKTVLGSYLAKYTKPIVKENQNIRYMWAINKESKTFFVIVNAENFKTIKMIPVQCDQQETPATTAPDIALSKIANLVKPVMAADGYVTKEIHDEFWDCSSEKYLLRMSLKKLFQH